MIEQSANNTIVAMVEEHRLLIAHLRSTGAISLLATVEPAFAKTLLVSAASYYEQRMTEILVGLYKSGDGRSTVLAEFVRSQAIGRRYAQLFNWSESNANSFFRSFGNDFRTYMVQKVRNDQKLDESIKAFLELGKFRNDLVHGNYADFSLNKTVDEVFCLYQKAGRFVEGFADNIREYINIQNSGN